MNTGHADRRNDHWRLRGVKAAGFLLAAAMLLQGCTGVGQVQDTQAKAPQTIQTESTQTAGERAVQPEPGSEEEKKVKPDEMEEVLKQVLAALDGKDAEGLKALFSEYALQNMPESEQAMQGLLDFYQGPSTGYKASSSSREWHSPFGREAGGSSLGHGFEYYRAAYTVSTGSGDYKLRLIYYSYNEEDPSLNGLFLLEAAEMDRYNESDFRFSDGETPGVFCYGKD